MSARPNQQGTQRKTQGRTRKRLRANTDTVADKQPDYVELTYCSTDSEQPNINDLSTLFQKTRCFDYPQLRTAQQISTYCSRTTVVQWVWKHKENFHRGLIISTGVLRRKAITPWYHWRTAEVMTQKSVELGCFVTILVPQSFWTPWTTGRVIDVWKVDKQTVMSLVQVVTIICLFLKCVLTT